MNDKELQERAGQIASLYGNTLDGFETIYDEAIEHLRDVYRAAFAAGLERAAQIAEAAENEEGSADERLGGLAAAIRAAAND